ncbi:hypothetical protein, partial [Muribaculum intestinale]|uniref:hypothetical protein n=1 Tax=Muribaculum intestinale TaxID=1796646 RepID=UPI0025B7188F
RMTNAHLKVLHFDLESSVLMCVVRFTRQYRAAKKAPPLCHTEAEPNRLRCLWIFENVCEKVCDKI